ncbi:MAG TPA: TonB family protein [Pyrinomonadaceae bacterium]
MKAHLTKFTLFLIFGIVSSISVLGQNNICSLQLNVLEFNLDKQIQNADNVKVILKEEDSKKAIEASSFSQMPQFTNLTAGKYKVELIKDGAKRREKTIELDCNLADKNGITHTNIYLWGKDIKEFSNNKRGGVQFVQGDSTVEFSKANCPNNSDKCELNKGAIDLVAPAYPPAARAVNASGIVNVQATIDEDGNIVSALVVDGHPLLRAAAVKAALKSKFQPTLLENSPVRVTGIIVYNFNL